MIKNAVYGSLLTTTLLSIILPAQSIDPKRPAPLKEGSNASMVDTTVGTQYWYFWGGPGATHVIARYRKSGGQFDAGVQTPLNVDMYDESRTWVEHKKISPQTELSEVRLDGNLKQRTKIIVSVSAPRGGLLRQGGDYELVVSGAIDFSGANAPQGDPIVHTFQSGNGLIKCLANGTIETDDGGSGTWKLFDSENRIYILIIGNSRQSLKLMPGQGLVQPASPSQIMYREVH